MYKCWFIVMFIACGGPAIGYCSQRQKKSPLWLLQCRSHHCCRPTLQLLPHHLSCHHSHRTIAVAIAVTAPSPLPPSMPHLVVVPSMPHHNVVLLPPHLVVISLPSCHRHIIASSHRTIAHCILVVIIPSSNHPCCRYHIVIVVIVITVILLLSSSLLSLHCCHLCVVTVVPSLPCPHYCCSVIASSLSSSYAVG